MLDKNICILAEDYPSEGRPVFVFVEQLVNALVNEGVNVSVIAPQSLTRSLFRRIPLLPKENDYVTTEGKKYKVYRPYSISFGNSRKMLYTIVRAFNARRINNVLQKLNPDILYGHFWHSAYKLLDYSIKYQKPLFVACGEGDNALENLSKSLSAERKKELVTAVKGVISVSSENKRKCIEFGLCKESDVIVLPNCVDTNLFHPNDECSFKKELGIKDTDFTIVFTGAFIKRKGSRLLAEAIDRLQDGTIKSIFIGRSLDGENYTPQCTGIIYRGTVSHELLPRYLNCADVFILPTLKEGCSNAIVEALACGLPVISSNKPFNDDILNEDNSLKIDPEKLDELIEAIELLRTDKKLFEQKKHYARVHSNQFSIVNRARTIINFIQSKI